MVTLAPVVKGRQILVEWCLVGLELSLTVLYRADRWLEVRVAREPIGSGIYTDDAGESTNFVDIFTRTVVSTNCKLYDSRIRSLGAVDALDDLASTFVQLLRCVQVGAAQVVFVLTTGFGFCVLHVPTVATGTHDEGRGNGSARQCELTTGHTKLRHVNPFVRRGWFCVALLQLKAIAQIHDDHGDHEGEHGNAAHDAARCDGCRPVLVGKGVGEERCRKEQHEVCRCSSPKGGVATLRLEGEPKAESGEKREQYTHAQKNDKHS